jgi:hypothetical protein
MPEPSKDAPISGPYCSDPACRYCKELREFADELRNKSRQPNPIEELSSSSEKPELRKRQPPDPLQQRESA